MTEALAPTLPALDPITLLARINHRLALLRTWLSHDHGDEPYWWARRTTAPRTQRERVALRALANLLHVERATCRGKIHSSRFPTLEAQRSWLASNEGNYLGASELTQLPSYATLEMLREGKLPL
ncbi:MAG: hypothetical protein ABI678_23370 [Kofleriaceae bacterium]